MSNSQLTIDQHLLKNGYTQFRIFVVSKAPVTAVLPVICVACGTSLEGGAEGKTESFEVTRSSSSGYEKLAFTACLCKACVSAGYPVSDFFQFGLTGDEFIIQIGNSKIADLFREILKRYSERADEVMADIAKDRFKDFPVLRSIPMNTFRSEQRYVPTEQTWISPLTKKKKSWFG
jgi:hypothetical protein